METVSERVRVREVIRHAGRLREEGCVREREEEG